MESRHLQLIHLLNRIPLSIFAGVEVVSWLLHLYSFATSLAFKDFESVRLLSKVRSQLLLLILFENQEALKNRSILRLPLQYS